MRNLIVQAFILSLHYLYIVSDPDLCPGKEIECIHCTSEDSHQYCKDPFLQKHALVSGKLKTVPCKEYCTKLVMQKNNRIEYIRTCSSNIGIKMEKNLVCIQQSRSSVGHLCFCNSDRCNHSNPLRKLPPVIILFVLIGIWCSVYY